jgi:hypothetical protein
MRLKSASDRRAIECTAAPAPDTADEQLAGLLIRMWSLASGRMMRRDVSVDQLTEDELIGFWADDFSPVRGRHAAHGPGAANR